MRYSEVYSKVWCTVLCSAVQRTVQCGVKYSAVRCNELKRRILQFYQSAFCRKSTRDGKCSVSGSLVQYITMKKPINEGHATDKSFTGDKNPAHGRHRISRPMLIEAPTQKKTYKDFSSSLGDLVKRGWAAVHSTAEHWSTFLSIELHYTSFLCSALHKKVFSEVRCMGKKCTVIQWLKM